MENDSHVLNLRPRDRFSAKAFKREAMRLQAMESKTVEIEQSDATKDFRSRLRGTITARQHALQKQIRHQFDLLQVNVRKADIKGVHERQILLNIEEINRLRSEKDHLTSRTYRKMEHCALDELTETLKRIDIQTEQHENQLLDKDATIARVEKEQRARFKVASVKHKEDLRKQREALEAKIAKLREEQETAGALVHEQIAKALKLQEKELLSSFDKHILRVRQDLDTEQQDVVVNLQSTVRSLQDKNTGLQEQLSSAKRNMGEIQKTVHMTNEEKEKLDIHVIHLAQRCDELEKQIEKDAKVRAALRTQFLEERQAQDAKMKALEEDHEAELHKVQDRVQYVVQKKTKLIHQLENALEEMERRATEAESALIQLDERLATARSSSRSG